MAGSQSFHRNLLQVVSIHILDTSSCPGLPIREFIAVFWRTWVVLLAPFLLSPMVFLSADDPKVTQGCCDLLWPPRPAPGRHEVRLPDLPDGHLLDDRGLTAAHHVHDSNGNKISQFIFHSWLFSRLVFLSWASCPPLRLQLTTSMPLTIWWEMHTS